MRQVVRDEGERRVAYMYGDYIVEYKYLSSCAHFVIIMYRCIACTVHFSMYLYLANLNYDQ